MKDIKNWAWLLFFGSLWGMSEVAAGGVLYKNDIPHSSIILTAWALLMLAFARGIINKPGTSTVIGAMATLFKLANASPFICHLAGIFALGVAFDVFFRLIQKKEEKISWKTSLTGLTSAYGGYALFALVITYVIRYSFWVDGGFPKVINHIFVGGSIAALLAAVIVPIGFKLGTGSEAAVVKRPRWHWAGALAGVVLLWVLGRFVG